MKIGKILMPGNVVVEHIELELVEVKEAIEILNKMPRFVNALEALADRWSEMQSEYWKLKRNESRQSSSTPAVI